MARLRWSSGIALLALTTAACGMSGGAGPNGASSGGGHLVYAEILAPASAWAPESDDAHALTRAGCLETLVRIGHDGSLEPMLATQWTQTERTTWEFTLREGVEFQNGTQMDAEAVAGALTHLLEVTSPARAINPAVVTGVKAVGERTVQITTPDDDPLLPLRMAGPNAGILAPEAYRGAQIDIQGTCTGPFTVTEEVPRQSLLLKRNENYWGGEVATPSAQVRFVVDGGTRTTQLHTGEASIVRSIPAANVSTVENAPEVRIEELEVPRTTVMLLNNTRPPFDDPLVRRALQKAIDTRAIVDSVYEGTGVPAVGPFGPATAWAPKGAAAPAADLDEARSLFDQAGVDPETLDIELIAYNDRPEFDDVAAVVQDQFRALGVDVKIRAGEYASVEPDMLAGDFDAALLSRGYLVDVADPAGFLLSDYTCDGGYNLAHYCDPETDQMVKEAIATKNVDARNGRYRRIAQKLQTDAASVFLLHEGAVWGTRSNVEHFRPHPLEYYVLTADLRLR